MCLFSKSNRNFKSSNFFLNLAKDKILGLTKLERKKSECLSKAHPHLSPLIEEIYLYPVIYLKISRYEFSIITDLGAKPFIPGETCILKPWTS